MRQSACFEVSSSVEASLGIISVGNVMVESLSKYGSSRLVGAVDCTLNVSKMVRIY